MSQYLFQWFWDWLYALGLWKKEATVLLLGLDNAGKTTLLNKLKTGQIGRFPPTQRAGTEEVEVGSVRLRAHDLGGHKAARAVWGDYFAQTDAIIYMVRERGSRQKQSLTRFFFFRWICLIRSGWPNRPKACGAC